MKTISLLLACFVILACTKQSPKTAPSESERVISADSLPGLDLPPGSVVRKYINIDATGNQEAAEINAYRDNTTMNPDNLVTLSTEKAAYKGIELAFCVTPSQKSFDDYFNLSTTTPVGCPEKGTPIPFRPGETYSPGASIRVYELLGTTGYQPIHVQWPNSVGGTGGMDLSFLFNTNITDKLADSRNYPVVPFGYPNTFNYNGVVHFGYLTGLNDFQDVVDEMCGAEKCTKVVIGLIKNFTRSNNPLAPNGFFNPACDFYSLSGNCSVPIFNFMSQSPVTGTEILLSANIIPGRPLTRDDFRLPKGEYVIQPAYSFNATVDFVGNEEPGFYSAHVVPFAALVPGQRKVRTVCPTHYMDMTNPSIAGMVELRSVIGNTNSLNGIYAYGGNTTNLSAVFTSVPPIFAGPNIYSYTNNCRAVDDNDPVNQ